MDNGKIRAVDTFNKLMKDHEGFRTLMETTSTEDKEEEDSAEKQLDVEAANKIVRVDTSAEDRE
ncbi:hypothetical protein, partial [Streptomyces sp. NPDC052701]|uniref:hypothetical protein n=1 Tax=Streptomyces sp. NPDC052701 TaxID=3155533 RepID=UPI003441C023